MSDQKQEAALLVPVAVPATPAPVSISMSIVVVSGEVTVSAESMCSKAEDAGALALAVKTALGVLVPGAPAKS